MKHSELISIIKECKGIMPKQKDLAIILNKPIGTINSRASRDLSYTNEELEKIDNYFNLGITNKAFVDDMCDTGGSLSLYYYPAGFLSCNSGDIKISDIKYKIEVPRQIISNYSPFDTYSVIKAFGDGMSPLIQNDDLLIIKHITDGQIQDGQIYILCLKNNIFIKRLVNNINQILIKSENPDYETIKLQGEDLNHLQIIGQIVGLMRGMK